MIGVAPTGKLYWYFRIWKEFGVFGTHDRLFANPALSGRLHLQRRSFGIDNDAYEGTRHSNRQGVPETEYRHQNEEYHRGWRQEGRRIGFLFEEWQ
jgi:hypothetical protein